VGFIEQSVIHLLLNFFSIEQINFWMRDPRTAAIIVGSLVAFSGAWLGVFLLLRGMSLTSDAISHTVLLGIVAAFLLMLALGQNPDVTSPLLLIGAALAGMATVLLSELIRRSGLVKADAALGLAFPLLFAISIILISSSLENVHLDEHTVLVGEIGLASANTNSYCFENCEAIVITPDSPQAEIGRRCTNCSRDGIGPRDAQAIFEEICTNCGSYSAAEAWRERLIDEAPELVFWPKSITVMSLISIINVLFIGLLYKEMKLAAFDESLAKALGFRPAVLTYALMTLVSLTAVGAFDAVGSILVVAFFVIPPATAYLLTDRLAVMLWISPLFGITGAVTGYELARGSFLGLPVSALLTWLDGLVGLGGYTDWNVSISASMVIMTFIFFLLAWVISPRYGLVSTLIRRHNRSQRFADYMLLGHIDNHSGTDEEVEELHLHTLHEHLDWTPSKLQASLTRVRLRGWVRIQDGIVRLTPGGQVEVQRFQHEQLRPHGKNEALSLAATGG